MSTKASFLVASYVEEEINGQSHKFYPLSALAALELRSLAKPLTAALSVIFSPAPKSEPKKTTKQAHTSEGTTTETVTEPVYPPTESVVLDKQRREKVLADAIDALAEPKNLTVVARLIADSLRDEYPRRPTDADLKKIVEGEGNDRGIDLPTLKAYLYALAKANKEVFGPLGERVSSAIDKLRAEAPTSN